METRKTITKKEFLKICSEKQVKKIVNAEDINQYLDCFISRKNVAQIERNAGVSKGLIARWKSNKNTPKFNKILRILEVLQTTVIAVPNDDTDEVVVLSEVDTYVGIINNEIKRRKLNYNTIEHNCNISSGLISRWKNAIPRTDTLLNVMYYVGIQLFFVTTISINYPSYVISLPQGCYNVEKPIESQECESNMDENLEGKNYETNQESKKDLIKRLLRDLTIEERHEIIQTIIDENLKDIAILKAGG